MAGKSSKRSSKNSLRLKKGFAKVLESLWKIPGASLPDEAPLPELPAPPLSKAQIDSVKDPLDLLIERGDIR